MKRMIFKLPYLRFGRAVLVLTALAGLMSCGTSFSDTTKDSETECLKLMNWNLQTFFDSNFDGNEYTEFKNKKSGWSQEKYEIRLDRLASVVKKLDADVVIMEEIAYKKDPNRDRVEVSQDENNEQGELPPLDLSNVETGTKVIKNEKVKDDDDEKMEFM